MSTKKPTARSKPFPIRFDHRIIESWIKPGSKVLDLGCGEGELLNSLKTERGISGVGIEQSEDKVVRCIAKGLSVIQGDINAELKDYQDNAFDFVILSQTLQQVYDPSGLIAEMLRVGKRAIVSFPNFNHWKIRLQFLATGRVPVTPELPYQWYDTPNIRVLSIRDFEKYAEELSFRIFRQVAILKMEEGGRLVNFMPNLLATYGVFLIGKPAF